jgi:hypothetical protein
LKVAIHPTARVGFHSITSELNHDHVQCLQSRARKKAVPHPSNCPQLPAPPLHPDTTGHTLNSADSKPLIPKIPAPTPRICYLLVVRTIIQPKIIREHPRKSAPEPATPSKQKEMNTE